jgi:hypothetical protein
MTRLTVLLQNRKYVSMEGHGRRPGGDREIAESTSINEHPQDKRKPALGFLYL